MRNRIHVGIILASGETYGVIFVPETTCEALYKLREWARNPYLSLTHEQADMLADALLDEVSIGDG